MSEKKSITVDGVEYVPKASLEDGRQYCIIRCRNAGVHAGYVLPDLEGQQWVTVTRSRRLWRWAGAATISQLANEGVKSPGDCKFAVELETLKLNASDICEIVPVSSEAKESIAAVPEWRS